MKKISIVTPCYNEELNVRDCYESVKRIFCEELPNYDFEHIFCDNASTDNTAGVLRDMASEDTRVKVVLNARNFGPFHSIFNGLRHASGDGIVVMLPADLQDPTEIIPQFVEKWEEGFKVVYGIRTNRQEPFLLRRMRAAYYRIVNTMANINLPLDVGEFQLVDRVVLDAMLQHEDYYPYIRGIIANCGFRSVGIKYEFRRRARGISSNNAYRLIDQGLNGIISFTNVPMRLTIFAGMVIAIASLLFALYTMIFQLLTTGSIASPGVTTVIVAIFFFGGIQLFTIGFLGEYIAAIHSQVRKKPLVVEMDTINL